MPQPSPSPVTLVVPCYQEEGALEAFGGLLPTLAVAEIVFVDDGSTDGTADRLAALALSDARVRCVRHPRNRGVGAAMRTGIAAATSDLILFYDADQPYPLEDVDRLLRALAGGADVATASPWAEGGSDQGVPAGRRALSRGAALAYRLVVGPSAHGVATFTCAFRAWRAPLLRSLAFRSDGFGAAAEMLGLALLEGARVAEVPSRLRARTAGASKMRVPRALAEHLRVLARLWRRRARGRAGRMTPA